MLRRNRTQEPTCTSIGFGLSDLGRLDRRIGCDIVINPHAFEEREGDYLIYQYAVNGALQLTIGKIQP
jgi:hypothetical protein